MYNYAKAERASCVSQLDKFCHFCVSCLVMSRTSACPPTPLINDGVLKKGNGKYNFKPFIIFNTLSPSKTMPREIYKPGAYVRNFTVF